MIVLCQGREISASALEAFKVQLRSKAQQVFGSDFDTSQGDRGLTLGTDVGRGGQNLKLVFIHLSKQPWDDRVDNLPVSWPLKTSPNRAVGVEIALRYPERQAA